MKSSIVSYPERGNYGASNYVGNCSGMLIRDLLLEYRPKTFCDPTLGGLTSLHVWEELRREGTPLDFHGLDLHSGFNLLKDNLSERIGGNGADFVFLHSPYGNLLKYSGNMWGNQPHPDDLSHSLDDEDFMTKMGVALHNIFDALPSGGRYTILIGDKRSQGVYTSYQSDLMQIAPGALDGMQIKIQHNCVSDRKRYSGSFTPIHHEYLLHYRKDRLVFGMLERTLQISRKLQSLANANWRAVVRYALNRLGGQAPLQEIYKVIKESAEEKTVKNANWQAKVRLILQQYFTNIERGVWAF